MELPSNIKNEIEQKAVDYAFDNSRQSVQYSYIAGATEYAEKYVQARKFLERLMSHHNATLPSEQLYNEIKSFLDGK